MMAIVALPFFILFLILAAIGSIFFRKYVKISVHRFGKKKLK
jgi:hypothetical protein